MGSPDSHTISEGQKSSGTSKTTRKGNEKSSEKEKAAQERQASRIEPQVGVTRSYGNHLMHLGSLGPCLPISSED